MYLGLMNASFHMRLIRINMSMLTILRQLNGSEDEQLVCEVSDGYMSFTSVAELLSVGLG